MAHSSFQHVPTCCSLWGSCSGCCQTIALDFACTSGSKNAVIDHTLRGGPDRSRSNKCGFCHRGEWPTGLQLQNAPNASHTSTVVQLAKCQNMKERPMHRARLPHTATHTPATFAEGAATRHRRATWQLQNVVTGWQSLQHSSTIDSTNCVRLDAAPDHIMM